MIKKHKLYLSSSCAIALLALASPASAQSTPAADGSSEAGEGAGGFQDIIVTARKRDERLQDVPVAIAALGSEDLTRYNSGTVAALTTLTPGLVASPSFSSVGGGNISLRGISSPSTGPTVDQSVAINIDGVQITKAFALRFGVFDIARVEVLKGPQALFYGKNSPAGVISFVSADPTDTFEAKVRAGYEFAAQKKYGEVTLSGPLGGGFGARLEVYASDEKGWFINTARPEPAYAIPAFLGGGFTTPTLGRLRENGPAKSTYFLRGTLSYDNGGAFDAKLKVNYSLLDQREGFQGQNQTYACPAGRPLYSFLLNTAGGQDCKLDRFYSESAYSPSFDNISPLANGGKPFFKDKQFLTSLSMNYDIGDNFTLSSVTGYWNLNDKFATNTSMNDQAYLLPLFNYSIKMFSEEVRLSSKLDGPLNFVLGGYYQNEKVNQTADVLIDSLFAGLFTGGLTQSPGLVFSNIIEQKTNAGSIFGQAIFDVIPEVQLTAGGRYSRETKSGSARGLPTYFAPTAYDVVLTPDKRSFSNFSPEVSLTYKPQPNLTLYASYRHGFKSGGFDIAFNVGAFGNPNSGDVTYNQEKAKGGEIGIKGTLADRQIQFDASVYSVKYTGLQVAAFNPLLLGFLVQNAGSARTRGVDLSLQAKPNAVPGLSFRSAVAYTNAQYLSFTNSGCYTGQTQANGCNSIASRDAQGNLVITPALATQVANAQDLSGRSLTRAPKWTINLGATQEFGIGGGKTLSFSADGSHSSSYQTLAEQDPRAVAKSAWRLNASVELRGRDDRWALALIGSNLTNVLRPLGSNSSAATGSGTGTTVASLSDLQGDFLDPRAVSLQMTVKF